MTPARPQEAWLRGPIEGVPPHLMPVFHSFAMVREDLAYYTGGLTTEDVWRRAGSLPSLGFHLRHIDRTVSMGFYSRRREIDTRSSFSVLG